MVLPIDTVFYYSATCPYCRTFDTYVLGRLELLGYVRVLRVDVEEEFIRDDPLITMNKLFVDLTNTPYIVITPLLVVRDPSGHEVYIAEYRSKSREEFIKKAIESIEWKTTTEYLLASVCDMIVHTIGYIRFLARKYIFSDDKIFADPYINKALRVAKMVLDLADRFAKARER